MLDGFADLRTRAVTPIVEALDSLGSEWTTRVLHWGMLAVLVAFARWRHLVVGLAAILSGVFIARSLAGSIDRVPMVDSIGTPASAPMPSLPVAALAITLVGARYALLPKGKLRNGWFAVSALAMRLLALSRIYLGFEHPTDVAVGAVVGVGLLAFRLFVPAAIFPISYQRKSSAHLSVRARAR